MKNTQNDFKTDGTKAVKDINSRNEEAEFEEFILTKEEFEKYQEFLGPIEEYKEGETQI